MGQRPMTEAGQVRAMLDNLEGDLCKAGCGIPCETFVERRELINGVKDQYAQAIAAAFDVGTCKNVAVINRSHSRAGYFFVCSECGLAVNTNSLSNLYRTVYSRMNDDGTPNLHAYRMGRRYEFERCPHCGRVVIDE